MSGERWTVNWMIGQGDSPLATMKARSRWSGAHALARRAEGLVSPIAVCGWLVHPSDHSVVASRRSMDDARNVTGIRPTCKGSASTTPSTRPTLAAGHAVRKGLPMRCS